MQQHGLNPLTDAASKSCERGAVLLFLAVTLLAILGFAALAIDLTMYSNARAQGINYARLAALAAVEEYFDRKQVSPGSGELEFKRSAVTRANAVSKTNYFFAIDSVLERIRPNSISLANDPYQPPSDVLLEGGHWIYDETTLNCEGTDTPPCFVPEDDNTQPINAVHISGVIYRPVSSFLANAAFGTQALPPVTVDVVAAAVPRHGCFAVDISPSVASATHHVTAQSTINNDLNDTNPSGSMNVINPTTGYGSFVGYYLPEDNPTVAAGSDLGKVMTNVHKPDWDMLYYSVLVPRGYAGDPGPFFPSPRSDVQHLKTDYIQLRQYGDNQYSSALHAELHPDPSTEPEYAIGPAGLWGRFDARHINQAGGYLGAEPLRSVFEAIQYTIDRFENRSVAGDEICFVFYDQSQKWSRIVKLTNDFDYLKKLVDFAGAPTGGAPIVGDLPPPAGDPGRTSAWQPVAPTESSPKGFERIVRYNLVPSPGGFTNMSGGLSEALKQLSAGQDSGVQSSDFVVLIGDGLTNCSSTMSPQCSDDLDYHKRSLADLQSVVADQVIPSHIPIHFILMGDYVQPHTVAIAKTDGGTCLSDAEARKAGLPYVMDQWFGAPVTGVGAEAAEASAYDNRSAAQPYWRANYEMYDIAASTGGTWGTLRPKHPACVSEGVPIASPTVCNRTPSLLQRVVYDEQCRSRGAQMTDFMDEILGSNPYVVVQVK